MADMCEFPRIPEFFDVDSMVDDSLTNTCTLFEENIDDTFPEPSLFDPDNCLSSVVQVQKTQEKSPFHESDSGVSEVSDFCGGSPSRESAVMLDEMLDNMKASSFLLDTDPDLELMNYLPDNGSGDEKSETTQSTGCKTQSGLQTRMSTRSQSAAVLKPTGDQTSKADASNGNEPQKKGVPRVVLRGRRSLNQTSGATRPTVNSSTGSSVSESDESDIEIDGGAGKAAACPVPRGSVRVSRPGSTLPSSSASTSTNCNVTSVKIVRVTNVGKTSTPEDDINKALEDRNRKNAEIAKANRLKKKAYVENLEKEVEEGRQKIDQLEMQLNDIEEERDACQREIHYLRSVLANQSALAGLLKNIPNVSGGTLSAPSSRKRVAELDHSYNTTKKSRVSHPQSTAGVCLHVDNDNVSLEFCHHCAEKSARSSQS